MTRRRVLLVSYHFPPVGGAGVQRPVKFARYLPEFGWDVSVLQAANPSVPLLDPSLCEEIPPETIIERARTFEPGYAVKAAGTSAPSGQPPLLRRVIGRGLRHAAALLLHPDAQVLWYPDAVRRGRGLLRRLPHDAILATAPTYTNLLVGRALARASGLPLISDFRDEWDLSSTYWENAPADRLSRALQRRMQRAVLRDTRAIIATTQASSQRLLARAAEARSAAWGECIYNGWDAHDLAAGASATPTLAPDPERFRLVYTGTLWNLTDITPLVRAVTALADAHPGLAGRLDVVTLGRKTPEQRAVLEGLRDTPAQWHDLDYAPHPVALATMGQADALLLLLSDVPGAERVAPAKLFEYLAMRRPILAIAPESETAGIVRSVHPDGHRVPSDVPGIAEWLRRAIADQQGGVATVPVPDEAIAPFARRHLAGQLATLLTRVVEESH
jgi:hypothetical protein